MAGQKRGISIQQKAQENGCSPSERCDMARVTVNGITESGQKTWERRGCRCYSSSLSSIYTFDGSDIRHWSYRQPLPPTRRLTYVSKCWPRLGSARRFAIVLRTLLSGRITMTGTGEWLRQYLAADASDQRKGRVRRSWHSLGHASDPRGSESTCPCLHNAPLSTGADDERIWAV